MTSSRDVRRHAVALPVEYVLAGHGRQSPPVKYVPAGHGVQALAPGPDVVPVGQGVQEPMPPVEYVPAGHGVHDRALAAE